jgi:hypothetical protein
VFSQQAILHFRTFGYVVQRNLLSDAEVEQLSGEVISALTDAYGGVGTDLDRDGTGGIRGDYLPLAADRAPLSQALMADDPRFYQGSVALLGGPTVPTAPMATCFTSNAAWHNDDGTDIGGVKFLVHLQPRDVGTGALRVIPGSHDATFRRSIQQYFGQDPARQGFAGWPAPFIGLETAPGDVIAFDVHLFHSSAGGSNRLAWTIEYLPWPGLGDPARLAAVRAAVVEVVDDDHRAYDRDRWPTWRDWAAQAHLIPSRQTAAERLRLLGVLGEGDPR